MIRINLLLALFALCFVQNTEAQQWEGGFFGGIANYQGDLTAQPLSFKDTKYSAGLVIRHNLNERFAIRGNLMFGKVGGADINNDSDDWNREDRGFDFDASISELSLKFEYSPLTKKWLDDNGEFNKSFSPYIFAGLGLSFWTPEVNFGDPESSVLRKSLQSKIDMDMDMLMDNKSGVVVPLGAGIKVDLTNKIVLGAEVGFRPTFNDYLDGISHSGNADQNDWYWFGGMAVTFRLADENEKKEPLPMITDTDEDGVLDNEDDCPDVAGKAMFNGCPDTDNDGYMDKEDKCPNIKGKLNGCPDTDGDGLADNEDSCPEQKGTKENDGCPAIVLDTDNDGVLDKNDACPNEKGLTKFSGCPDTDGDGIQDLKDRCPVAAGPASNGGCPEVIAPSDQATLDLVVKNVRFETSSAVLKMGSFVELDKVVAILNKYSNYSLKIDGFTDNVGDSASNLKLSERRAKACYTFLITKGITASRLTYKGYGESNPISDNKTKEGRRLNRRVEFNLY